MPPIQTTTPGTTPGHRIGAVSALSGVPVPTLRVWEIRYATFSPRLSGGGQRLYSDDDVLRATLLKRLTEQGHAISSIANHDASRLNTLLQQQNTSQRRDVAKLAEAQTVSAAVVGLDLAARLATEKFKKIFSANAIQVTDIFPDLAAIETQFHHLVRTVPASGRLVVNAREAALDRVLARGCWSGLQRFGARKEEPGALRARGEPHAFDVLRGSLKIARVDWQQLGEHNQLNALAAIAAAEHVGVPPEQAAAALASFRNVRRRLELRGEVRGVKVYDDFAHHPTAMRTTLNGLRRKAGLSRVLVVFEPRTNTMKRGEMKALLPWALEEADLSFCLQGNYGWSATEALAPLGAQAVVADSVDALVAAIVQAARPGDQVLVMSNGGFGGIHDKLLAALGQA